MDLDKLDKIEVNETHICVLRKRDGEDEVFVDFVELKLLNDNQLVELKEMSKNENRSVLELIDYIENSNLNDLTKSFNFCKSLGGAFQSCSWIQKISYSEYHKLLDEYELKIREAETQEDKDKVKERKQDFIRSKRESFYKQIESHVIPYLLECKYAKLEKDDWEGV